MLSRNHPDRIPNHLRRPPPGGQCRAAPSGHPGPASRPARTRPAAPRPGRCPGAGERGRQDDDAGGLRAGWRDDCIDDADVLRTGGTACTLGGTVKAPSTLGAFLRSFRWGHVRQLDRVSRELLARAWQAGAGPGDGPLTIDLDSTICETYGLAKEGARHHGYTGQAGLSPPVGHRRRHRRRADVPAARGPRQHRSGRRPLPA